MYVDLDDWYEWKKMCALDLCSDMTKYLLNSFAHSRFRCYIRRYAVDLIKSVPDNPWHLLETHMTVTETGNGKRYKDWLFERIKYSDDDPLNVVQGGATLIMRDVVRDYLTSQCPEDNTISIFSVSAGNGIDELTILDLLSSETDLFNDVCANEYKKISYSLALDLFDKLSREEKLVLSAKSFGIALHHPSIERISGYKKTYLYKAFNQALETIVSNVKARYPDEDPEALLALVYFTYNSLCELLYNNHDTKKAIHILRRDHDEITQLEFAASS